IFRRISHIGVLSLIAIAIHYTPNPSIFSNYQSMFSTQPFELLLKLPLKSIFFFLERKGFRGGKTFFF
ncbi:MAG: hypothetical protein IKA22_13255, partial [Lentisphaeria bacterium]|nr:hypothetical protein [Lentisphaeria bacterium]